MKKQVNELSLERAKTLLGNKEMDEQKLIQIMEKVKVFCKVSYQLYLKGVEPEKTAIIISLESEPPNEFTNAA